jgi:hypothetical protein
MSVPDVLDVTKASSKGIGLAMVWRLVRGAGCAAS